MHDNWFQTFKSPKNIVAEPGQQLVYLFCFAHAGGSASFFYPWVEMLPNWIKLVAIQLPGRWNRVNEAPYLRMENLISTFGPIFVEYLKQNNIKNYAIYGHSLGGLIAYELIKYLSKQGCLLPYYLFISSKRSPQISAQSSKIYHLADIDFELALTKMYGALPPEITGQEETKKMFLDITKKDMELLDTYIFKEDQKLNIPTTILGGLEDHTITKDTLEPWKQLIDADYELVQLSGGHFFMKQSQKELMDLIIQRLSEKLPNEQHYV